MQITSFTYISFFCLTFICYYHIVGKYKSLQNFLLLFVSYLFYGSFNVSLLPVLFIVQIIGYFSCNIRQNSKLKKTITFVSIAFILLLLLYYKYADFIVNEIICINVNNNISLITQNIITPIGLSFFSFRAIGSIIDSKKQILKIGFVDYSLYICFFPTLVAGPIDRVNDFTTQLSQSRIFDYHLVILGLKQILWGLFKKLVIADGLSKPIDLVWNNYTEYSNTSLILAVVLYSFQIYCDFSGYSDIAIGSAKMFGIQCKRNFNCPYFSRNIQEFWRKWHISLTSWFTDYVYIPLGGNRCSRYKHLLNTLIVFTLSGLWHGANWTYIAWGVYHGLILCILILIAAPKYKTGITENSIIPSFNILVKIIYTFILVTIGWILFRSPSLSDFISFIDCISFSNDSVLEIEISSIVYFSIIVMIILEWLHNSSDVILDLKEIKTPIVRHLIYYSFIVCIILSSGKVENFIYAQF